MMMLAHHLSTALIVYMRVIDAGVFLGEEWREAPLFTKDWRVCHEER